VSDPATAIRYDADGPVVIVTIDRPEVANAVDRPTAAALADAFRRFDGDEAFRIGLANRLVPPGQALAAATELAHEIASWPQAALRSDRASSYQQWSLTLDQALANEYEHGMATLRTGELFGGLDDYASGGWRQSGA
jgi:enoyl-CoA hydratase/carnithine racemase